ncbi:2-hydroxyacid dehydrogenase [Oceanobacillus picturae]|uniref:2-hydroxyacid dehydrogenase n=1 Tax=Oceanobacillus picturae TaxID=171693 RepID=UPI00073D3C7C|nr:D-glycerate dehydrogenase [Oceanobacillus picturae]RIU94685.1 D-glycerate dehydrogenase [Oceanobacillus picturae]
MEKPKLYITRKVPEKILEPFQQDFTISMWKYEEEPVPREVLLKEISDAHGVLCMLSETMDQEIFNTGSSLQVVANLAVGYDNIDLHAAREAGVVVTNTPGVLTESTADLAFSLLLSTARRIVEANQYIKEDKWKQWSPYLLAGMDVHNKTIGIVGMGRIGEAIARRAQGFGMEILYHNRSRKVESEKQIGATYVDFDTLLNKADFVVSVVPATPQTNQMFNKEAFQKMKRSSIFINISRGSVVNENALVEALEMGEISAAGLDVFAEEPIRSDHPLLDKTNVICLPHIGSASTETRSSMLQLCLENISGVIHGTGPITEVK